ncbi:MAG: M56 family metallopeptidase [Muribaculaceae bacterium]|nr:M56 family metallopeptidase [Muribaculaceae bacterium]
MGPFAAYTFSSGLILLVLYIIYKWLLSAENQPRFNRHILLGIYAAAFTALPLYSLMKGFGSGTLSGTVMAELGSVTPATVADLQSEAAIWPRILLFIYLAGIAATALWTLATAIRIARIIASGERIHHHGFTLVLLDRSDVAPFSWGRYVVMCRHEQPDAADIILTHEQAHIGAGHFADLLLAQAVCIVLWYNPASWLMLRELKDVHEYEADERVLSSGINARNYQLLLIKKAVGVRFPSLANSLNHSKLKKRITMMYNQKSSPVRRSRALALVPAAALALVLLNIPAISRAMHTVSDASLAAAAESGLKVTNSDAAVQVAEATAEPSEPKAVAPKDNKRADLPDKFPSFPGGEAELFHYISQNIRYPEDAVKGDLQGRVAVAFTITKDGSIAAAKIVKSVAPSLDAEALRVVNSMPRWTPASKDGKPVDCTYTLPVSFKLQGDDKDKKDDKLKVVGAGTAKKSESSDSKSQIFASWVSSGAGAAEPAIFLNDKPYSGKLSSIDNNDIESVTVRQDDPKYPNGVLYIVLKAK